jgi:hypothetical protein
VHWFSGFNYPRSVTANGGIYCWNDGRTNPDTMTAVFEYGPEDLQPGQGFQVVYSSRMHNAAGGTKEIYYSNGGSLNLDTNQITPDGGLTEEFASAMGMQPFLLRPASLDATRAETGANTGSDPMTSAHMRNWLSCLRSRHQPHAPISAGYYHSIANIMTRVALQTGRRVQFNKDTQEVEVS